MNMLGFGFRVEGLGLKVSGLGFNRQITSLQPEPLVIVNMSQPQLPGF